jgi:tellurite resistance protein TehA-like permease
MFSRKKTPIYLLLLTLGASLVYSTGKVIMETGVFVLTGLAGIGAGFAAGALFFPKLLAKVFK